MTTNSIVSSIGSTSSVSARLEHVCNFCGENFNTVLIHSNNYYYNYYNPNGQYICEDCLDEDSESYRVCCCCGEVYPISETRYCNDYDSVCDTCFRNNDNVISCPSCGETVYITDINNAYCPVCDVCFSNATVGLRNYHDAPALIFNRTENDAADERLYFGLEYETDDGDCLANPQFGDFTKAMHSLDEEELQFFMEHDGSIDGVEVISHPMTFDYAMNVQPIDKICAIAEKYGYTNEEGRAGIHIHMSRAFFGNADQQDVAGAKLAWLFNKYWTEFLIIANRERTDYCEKPDADIEVGDPDKYAAVKAKNKCSKHYSAVNLENEHTFEIRIFNGTTEAWRVRGYIQLVYVIANYCKMHSFSDCYTVKFLDIFKGYDFNELNTLLSDFAEQ